MALNKQIWLSTLVENLYPDNSFAVKSIDDSAFVGNKTVHIPNAGAPSKVVTNRAEKPAKVEQRSDNELTYDMDELTTNPVYIPNVDTVELSYDKRQSILANDRTELQNEASMNILKRWAPGASGVLLTSGTKQVVTHTSEAATGKRLSLCRGDLMKLMTAFDAQNIPEQGRYLLLDAYMYAELLSDLNESDKWAFMQTSDVKTGVLGNIYGWNIMKRSKVLRLSADKALLDWDAAAVAGELPAALAWQQGCVSRALGEVKMFSEQDSPTYYGDIYSFLVRTGGGKRRYDGKGIMLLAGATTV